MDIEKAKGFADQELLFQAYVTFASKKIGRSENITKGILRQAVSDWVTKNETTLKEVKNLEEQKRLESFIEMVDIFIDKTSHLIQSNLLKKKFKEDILQIYHHWKSTKRQD